MEQKDFEDVINKRLLERGYFSANTKIEEKDYKKTKKYSKKKKFGEITGTIMKAPEIDKGLPLRISSTETRKHDPVKNRELDCEVFNADSDENDTLDGLTLCSNNSNAFGIAFFDHLNNKINETCISPFLIVLFFGAIYICSNKTHLQNFFYFPKKKILLETFNEIITSFGKTPCLNILFSKNHNKEIDEINNLLKIIEVKNITKVNEMLFELSKGTLKFGINESILKNLVGLSSINIITTWKYSFSYKRDKMLIGENMIGNFYKDDNLECLELMFNDGVTSMGFINADIISFDYYKSIITNFKTIEFKEIMIPAFSKHYRFRLLKSLQMMGLKPVFESDLINGTLSEVIQHVYIKVVGSGSKKYKPKKMSTIKFVTSSTFIFYIRNIVSDILILIGKFTIS